MYIHKCFVKKKTHRKCLLIDSSVSSVTPPYTTLGLHSAHEVIISLLAVLASALLFFLPWSGFYLAAQVS